MIERRLTCPGDRLPGRGAVDREPCRSANVVVVTRRGNYSRFSGSRFTPSAYSELRCLDCGRFWRSKSNLVDLTRNAKGDESHRAIP